MEKVSVQAAPGGGGVQPAVSAASGVEAGDWRQALPVLRGAVVTLREPRLSDAGALWSAVASDAVSRFMASPPASVEGFERFIAWTERERAAGNFACFVVIPHGTEQPIGLFQLRRLDSTFETAEWGFAIGSDFWHSGVYADAAALVLEFAFTMIGVRRLEARVAVANGRGNGALHKMGATCERVLEGSLVKNGERLDQALWTIHAHDWRRTRHSGMIH